jgi:hypothetical protein
LTKVHSIDRMHPTARSALLALLGFRPPNQESVESLNKIAKVISDLPTDDKAYTIVGDAGQDTVEMLRIGGPISIEFFTDAFDVSTTTGSLESITGPEYQLRDGRQVPIGRNAPLPSLPKSYGGRTGIAQAIPSVAGAVKLQFYDERGKDLGTKFVRSGGPMVATQFGVVGDFYPKTKRIEPPPGAVAARVTIFDGSASLLNVSGLGAKVTTK